MKSINSFKGEFCFLSNFFESPFVIGGIRFKTVEHFFQSMKTNDPKERETIIHALTPGKAKRLGRKIKLREDWDTIKIDIMKFGLIAKFEQHPDLKEKLLATDGMMLVEGNTWGDVYWGFDFKIGRGENNLGKILMELREIMKINKLKEKKINNGND